MSVTRCYLCERNPIEARRLGGSGLQDGQSCPICFLPTCSHHMVTVRWKWRTEMRDMASAQVCQECKRAYRYRAWDPIHREWIS